MLNEIKKPLLRVSIIFLVGLFLGAGSTAAVFLKKLNGSAKLIDRYRTELIAADANLTDI